MAEKLDNFDWTQHIQNSHGTDALRRTLAEAKAIGMPDIHGHHIEYKKARNDADIEAQNILTEHNIDPMFGKEVLVYAPNNRDGKGHSVAFNRETQDAIRKVGVKASHEKLSKEQTRKLIVTELQRQAERWIEKQWPGYLKKHSIFN